MEAFLSSLPAQVQRYASNANDAVRAQIKQALGEAQRSLEPPGDTLKRVMYNTLELASLRVSIELKVFNRLVDSKDPLSASQLAEGSTADPVLLARFLRQQASLGFIEEAGPDLFTANNITHNLSIEAVQACLRFHIDVSGPVFQALPGFLLDRNYQSGGAPGDGAFQSAFATDLSYFEWAEQRPQVAADFNKMMYLQRSNIQSCFEVLSLSHECKDWPDEMPVFVDVGGGTGGQCMALHEKYPSLPGRIILEDLPSVVAEAKVSDDIEVMPYDFLTPQPIKGSKYYCMRSILHDHPDEVCLRILHHVVGAMGDKSSLLIDEVVVPSQGVEPFVANTDLSMMAHFSSMERTETQWRKLLSAADLKLQHIRTYGHSIKASIIIATL